MAKSKKAEVDTASDIVADAVIQVATKVATTKKPRTPRTTRTQKIAEQAIAEAKESGLNEHTELHTVGTVTM